MNVTISTQLAAATLIEEHSLTITEKYFYYVVVVLLLWDLLLTFDAEVAFFWRRRISGAAALFFANRYLTLLIALYNASCYGLLHYSNTRHCTTIALLQAFFQHSQYVVWAAFNCLRVYALQRPRWRCATVVLALSLAVVAADVVQLPSAHSSLDRTPLYAGCSARNSKTTLPGFYSAQICCCMLLVAAELVVMAVTWAEMAHYRQSTDFRRVLTLSCVLYENGRAYFVSTMVMHTLHLVSPLLSLVVPTSPARAPDMMSLSIILIEPIIAILVNRFLLALQAAAASAPHSDDTLAFSASGRGSVGLLQFVRADVDEWIQSEGAAPVESVDSDEVTLDMERRDGECGTAMRVVLQRVGSAA